MMTFHDDLAKERRADYKICKLPLGSVTLMQGVEIFENLETVKPAFRDRCRIFNPMNLHQQLEEQINETECIVEATENLIARLHAENPEDREFLNAVLRQIKSLAAAARKAVDHAKRPIERAPASFRADKL